MNERVTYLWGEWYCLVFVARSSERAHFATQAARRVAATTVVGSCVVLHPAPTKERDGGTGKMIDQFLDVCELP